MKKLLLALLIGMVCSCAQDDGSQETSRLEYEPLELFNHLTDVQDSSRDADYFIIYDVSFSKNGEITISEGKKVPNSHTLTAFLGLKKATSSVSIVPDRSSRSIEACCSINTKNQDCVICEDKEGEEQMQCVVNQIYSCIDGGRCTTYSNAEKLVYDPKEDEFFVFSAR